jgi:hypothetical protein
MGDRSFSFYSCPESLIVQRAYEPQLYSFSLASAQTDSAPVRIYGYTVYAHVNGVYLERMAAKTLQFETERRKLAIGSRLKLEANTTPLSRSRDFGIDSRSADS